MPETTNGRLLIIKYLERNGISQTRLGSIYGKSRQTVNQILKGKLKGKTANEFILRVLEDFDIR